MLPKLYFVELRKIPKYLLIERDDSAIGTVESSVYLERTRGSRRTREPQDVISYPEDQGNARPQIKWLSARELVVAIPAQAQAHLDLQVVKFADIQIKLEVIPSGISSSGSAATAAPR
jgi:hypothetical protein